MKLILLAVIGVVGSQALRAPPRPFRSEKAAKEEQGDDYQKNWQGNEAFFLADPDHPGAHRYFEYLEDYKVKVTGDDGEGTKEWTVMGEKDEYGTLALDFSPMGGPKQVTAHFKGKKLIFDSGMEWQMTVPEKVAVNYNDPNHPGCPRTLKVEGSSRVILTGADQAEGAKDCKDGKHGPTFEVKGYMIGGELHMDFSPKGGPKDLTGTFDPNFLWEPRHEHMEISWADGNRWRETMKDDEMESIESLRDPATLKEYPDLPLTPAGNSAEETRPALWGSGDSPTPATVEVSSS